MNRNIENKYNILKIRLMNVIEEHTDALSLAQQFKQDLANAKNRIEELEQKLREKDVEEKRPGVTISNDPVDTTKD